jgi:uncharacterized protein YgiB involved in biofilm formation
MQKQVIATLLIALSGLAGCGQDETKAVGDTQKAQRVSDRGIFLSSEECAVSEKLSIGECSEAILKALTEYDTKNAGYENEADCVAAFGHDRCEVRIGGRYRARAQAFLVTLELPADAVSLFAPSRAIVGFQSASGQEIDATDHTLLVSEAALALAKENAGSPAAAAPDGSSDALARAASKIH